MSEWAGRLRERIVIERPDGVRDGLGGASGGFVPVATCWAALAPDGPGPVEEADARAALPRWTIELRRQDVRPGDRIGWRGRWMVVAAVTAAPGPADRMTLIAEEMR